MRRGNWYWVEESVVVSFANDTSTEESRGAGVSPVLPKIKAEAFVYRLDQAMPSGSVPTAKVLVTFREATSTKVSRLAAELVI
jgi:hypothetical protein